MFILLNMFCNLLKFESPFWLCVCVRMILLPYNQSFSELRGYLEEKIIERAQNRWPCSNFMASSLTIKYSSLYYFKLLSALCVCIFEPRSGYIGQSIGWFLPSPSKVWQVSLVTGRLTNSPTLRFIHHPHSQSHLADKVGEWFCFKTPETGIEVELHSPSWPFSEHLIH